MLDRFPSFHSSHHIFQYKINRLCDEGAGSGGLVSPGWGENTDGLVVTGEAVDTRLDENQTELSILVFAVTTFEMLADGDGLCIALAPLKLEAK